ncbi:MAG: DNA repair protein RadA [Pseudomonadota bacterium]|nr:DNA repair protein RadA [Gammaproteobacteria bacterium]MBU1558516.1 DNA repair protein RadA [Gammaproteobacteria bacterium]MBU1629411.1 DNA repair protein RadA [Gammaproteobacteria bacterium]MBU1926491.1 DNA repair protein RadA [Gammaproteobacteria bacterium]MBU2546007.1 DNA repair protein RadA [Gammaproteobacteria bacterium]
MKTKSIYVCAQCGSSFPKWSGQCGECGAWNCLVEEVQKAATRGNRGLEHASKVVALADVEAEFEVRFSTGMSELNRVLGTGLVTGSVVLIGGDPGIGKSTLLLQALCAISNGSANQKQKFSVLYVTGEESLQQVSLRAKRLGLNSSDLKVLADTHIETIVEACHFDSPRVIVIDSIQTMYTDQSTSSPGSVSQVRESAALLVQFAKQHDIAVFIVGHVTREGTIAGPRILEHMVDTVLYFEGNQGGRFRILRAVKNRFGAVNELGVFAMTDRGLKEVNNPSAIFLSREETAIPGSIVMATWEGTRPLLVEVQALVDKSYLANPRRVAVGLEQNRLSILLAVMHRHAGIATYDQDIFVNVVGGVKIVETAVDLPILMSVLSSMKNKPLPSDWIVFGEVGLAGEIRPVPGGVDRIKEAAQHGFKRAIVPFANAPKKPLKDLEVVPVKNINEAIQAMREG